MAHTTGDRASGTLPPLLSLAIAIRPRYQPPGEFKGGLSSTRPTGGSAVPFRVNAGLGEVRVSRQRPTGVGRARSLDSVTSGIASPDDVFGVWFQLNQAFEVGPGVGLSRATDEKEDATGERG